MNRRWSCHFGILAGVILISILLFRGFLDQGMEMDEVTRVINLIPLVNGSAEPAGNALLSIRPFGIQVPVMFKEYISSAYLIRFLPLVLFDDPLLGIRFLHWFYFVLAAVTFYVVAARHSLHVAGFGALLIISSPLFYPEVRIGFADTLHIAYLSASAFFLERFFLRGERRRDLFLGVFLLFFCANQMFYFSWVIAAAGLAALILFPGYVWKMFRKPSRVAMIALGAGLGLVNFVVYNVMSGMPTAVLLFNRWFRPEEYARAPIDFKESRPLGEEIWAKLDQLPGYFDLGDAYLLGYGLVLAIAAGFLLAFLWQGKLVARRIYFAAPLAFVISLALILLSPNTTRVGHYVYLVPALQLSVLSVVLLAAGAIGSPNLSGAVRWGVPLLVLAVNVMVSNSVVAQRNRTGGTGLFTPAVFEFSRYLERESIESGNVLFTVWGLYAQPYFLRWGDFRIRQVVYSLIDLKEPGRQRAFFENLFRSYQALPASGDRLYLPLFAHYRSDINESLLGFLADQAADVTLEQTFHERTGEPAILLYRVDRMRALLNRLTAGIRESEVCREIAVGRFGPDPVEAGRTEDLAMWFMGTALTPETRVTLDGVLLRTVFAGDHVTALVPAGRIREPGEYPIFLYETRQDCRSNTVQLKVE